MANGYASNIPRENVPEAPSLLDEGTCFICKKRGAAAGGDMCAVCAARLGLNEVLRS